MKEIRSASCSLSRLFVSTIISLKKSTFIGPTVLLFNCQEVLPLDFFSFNWSRFPADVLDFSYKLSKAVNGSFSGEWNGERCQFDYARVSSISHAWSDYSGIPACLKCFAFFFTHSNAIIYSYPLQTRTVWNFSSCQGKHAGSWWTSHSFEKVDALLEAVAQTKECTETE